MDNCAKETREPLQEEFVECRAFKRNKKSNSTNRKLKNHIKPGQVGLRITKTFLLDVSVNDTIGSIKDKARLLEQDSHKQQKFFFVGNHLEDTKTMADYNLTTDSIIDIDVEVVMQVLVKIPSMDKTLKLEVNCTDTVHNLKAMIEDEAEFSSNHQLLVFCGETLQDHQVLVACGVRKDSVLYVMFNPLAEVLLYVRTSHGDFFSVEAMAGYTIRDIKAIVESLKGTPASRQRFFCEKQELLDSSSLSFCKILHDSVLHLHVQMQIFVKIETGRRLLSKLKKSKANLNALNFKLMFSGKVLLEHNTLAFYKIESESEVVVIDKAPCDEFISVTIEHMDGSRRPLSLRHKTVVTELKILLEFLIRRKFVWMKLRCKEDGVELKDEKLTLADYKVKHNAVLCLSHN